MYRDPEKKKNTLLEEDIEDSKEETRKASEVVRDLLCNKEYVVNTTCVVLLAGVSFAISGILDSVVTSNDKRFDDDDASYVCKPNTHHGRIITHEQHTGT